MKNHQEVEKSLIFSQNTPEQLISSDLKLEDAVYSPLALTTIVMALETRSETARFTKNHQKIEKSPIFDQPHPEIGSVQPFSPPVAPHTPTTSPTMPLDPTKSICPPPKLPKISQKTCIFTTSQPYVYIVNTTYFHHLAPQNCCEGHPNLWQGPTSSR